MALTRAEAMRALAEAASAIRSFGVEGLAIAGSVARDEAAVGSDIDVVGDMDLSGHAATRYFGLIECLEDLLHCEIDLLTRDRIKPHVRPFIEAESVSVF